MINIGQFLEDSTRFWWNFDFPEIVDEANMTSLVEICIIFVEYSTYYGISHWKWEIILHIPVTKNNEIHCEQSRFHQKYVEPFRISASFSSLSRNRVDDYCHVDWMTKRDFYNGLDNHVKEIERAWDPSCMRSHHLHRQNWCWCWWYQSSIMIIYRPL